MLIKIDGRYYSSDDVPIMIIPDERELDMIKNTDSSNLCFYPKSMTISDMILRLSVSKDKH